MRSFQVVKSLVAAATVLFACQAFADEGDTIVQNAIAAGQFRTLVALVQKAGLVDALNSTGPLTVFAPTDAAFAKLGTATLTALGNDVEALKKVLLLHVAPGNFSADRIVLRKEVKMLGGVVGCHSQSRCIFNGQLLLAARVGDRSGEAVRVAIEDITASNGTIHAIDTVILPPKSH